MVLGFLDLVSAVFCAPEDELVLAEPLSLVSLAFPGFFDF